MIMRYGSRLWKLRVLNAELKFTIRLEFFCFFFIHCTYYYCCFVSLLQSLPEERKLEYSKILTMRQYKFKRCGFSTIVRFSIFKKSLCAACFYDVYFYMHNGRMMQTKLPVPPEFPLMPAVLASPSVSSSPTKVATTWTSPSTGRSQILAQARSEANIFFCVLFSFFFLQGSSNARISCQQFFLKSIPLRYVLRVIAIMKLRKCSLQ